MKFTNLQQVIELLEAYGYSIQEVDEGQKKTRMSSEKGFLDIWNGRKGIILGIQIKGRLSLLFHRVHSLVGIEECLMGIKHK